MTTRPEQKPESSPPDSTLAGEDIQWTEDLRLVEGCVRGDRRCWAQLVERFERSLYHAIASSLRRCGARVSGELVDDLQADLMVELVKDDFRRLRKYSGRCKLDHWLKVVAGNYTIDRLRKRREHLSLNGDDPVADRLRRTLADARPAPEQAAASRQQLRLLAELCRDLPEDDQRFITLFYGEGRTFAETAELMETSVDAIYARKSRIRQRLRSMVRRREEP